MFDRRSLRRRRPLHGRHASYRRNRMALVLLWVDVPAARSDARRRSLAGDVVGAPAEHTAVSRPLAAAPATGCVLEAWFGMRGLRSDPMSGVRGRWLDRCL